MDKEIIEAAKILMKIRGNKCENCNTKRSPIWRIINGEELCNACGIYYKRYKKKRTKK
jgi:hypothetical protein